MEELNEDEENEADLVDELETKNFNSYGTIIFLILGTIIWMFVSITVGKIAADITHHWFFKWLVYLIMYFLFLRIPFGIGNKTIQRNLELEVFPEKILFAFVMITFYIVSICCYESLPNFMKWHLSFLA